MLAHGEISGHAHAVPAAAADLREDALGRDLFLTVRQPCELVHEEHRALALGRGHYRVTRQRQYTPAGTTQVHD